jgi:Tol biopolymer transport system component
VGPFRPSAAFSPSGKSLAFVYGDRIRVARVERLYGSKPNRLLENSAGLTPPACGYDSSPRWSRTGRQIIFERYVPPTCSQTGEAFEGIYRLTRGSTEVPEIRRVAGYAILGLDPDWSPRRQIAFQEERQVANELTSRLFVMGRKGTGLRQLTSGPNDRAPSWASDGTAVAFTRGTGIYTVRADGSRLRKLTSGKGGFADTNPIWSPDGKKIAFVRPTRTGEYVELIGARGGRARRLVKVRRAVNPSLPEFVAGLEWQPLPR